MSEPTFDMIVVGAGPAGCAAAIRGAGHGLRVAIVERARFPRDVPGEALHPDVDAIFDSLGVRQSIADAEFLKYPGWMLEHRGETLYVPLDEPPAFRFGYQVWRAQFDSLLLEHARNLGVTVFQPATVREPLVSGDCVIGVRTLDTRLTARHVIDATGPRRWLSHRMSIRSIALSPRLVAWYGYSTRDFGLGLLPHFREHADGWTWLAKVREGTFQCVRLPLVPDTELPALPPDFGFPEKLRGADVTWRLIPDCAGPGYFICGDAVAALDPAASGGVARALESGLRSADLVADIERGDSDTAAASQAYRAWLTTKIYADAVTLASRHAVLDNAPPWVRQFADTQAAGTIA